MKIVLTLNNSTAFGFSTNWMWKGKHHGIPRSYNDGNGSRIEYYYGFFWMDVEADSYDFMLRYLKAGNIDKFLKFNCVESCEEFMEQYKPCVSEKRFKQVKKVVDSYNICI